MGQRQSEIIKNHMEVYWHDYASASKGVPITEAGLVEKASVIGRTGLMLLECGTGAWRVRSSMNTLSRELGVTTTADIGLLSIEFTCFDGDQCYTQSLCLTNTGVNTSRLNRLEHFVNDFDREGKFMTGEELHSHLDEIERISNGLRYQKPGYKEFYSRIGRKFYELEPTDVNDVFAICSANGVTDRKDIDKVIKEASTCDFDLRRVRKSIHKVKRMTGE